MKSKRVSRVVKPDPKPPCPLEKEEQKRVVKWFRETYPEHKIVSIRNDGYRTKLEKVEQIRMGLCVGAADLYIPLIHTWVEMKRVDNGSPWSDDQKEFNECVTTKCYDLYYLCAGADDAISIIDYLMKGE